MEWLARVFLRRGGFVELAFRSIGSGLEWLTRVFLREEGYFGRGGFVELVFLTFGSIGYGLVLLFDDSRYLPASVEALTWAGIPVWLLATPYLVTGSISLVGIALLRPAHRLVSWRVRLAGMSGQFSCYSSSVIMMLLEFGPHLTEVGLFQVLFTLGALRTLVLIWFRKWA
jgi:hypothetical protein